MNPISLVRESAVVIPEERSGYHTIIRGPEVEIRPIKPENINMEASTATKDIVNHGIICTKAMVFKVARELFFEVNPIHIPNQLIRVRNAIASGPTHFKMPAFRYSNSPGPGWAVLSGVDSKFFHFVERFLPLRPCSWINAYVE